MNNSEIISEVEEDLAEDGELQGRKENHKKPLKDMKMSIENNKNNTKDDRTEKG